MDWQGQKLAEHLLQIFLIAFAITAFIVGYSLASFQLMLAVYAGGVVLTSLMIIPNWPWFNKHPLKWLEPGEAEKYPKPVKEKEGAAGGGTKKKGWAQDGFREYFR
ncbi:Signal peptidase complex subunit 1-like protein [Drosera capensis]